MPIRAVNHDFQEWIYQATRGLPQSVSEQAVSELHDHFENALEELLDQGHSRETALHRALEQLGEPHQVRHDLMQVHMAHRRYRRAAYMCWSMLGVIAIYSIEFLWQYPLVQIINMLVGFALIMAIMLSLRQFLVHRELSSLNLNISCIWLGAVLMFGTTTLDLLVHRCTIQLSFGSTLLHQSNLVGSIAFGLGLLLFNDHFRDWDAFGLRIPLRLILVITSFVLLIRACAHMFAYQPLVRPTELFALVSLTLMYLIYALFFIRAANEACRSNA